MSGEIFDAVLLGRLCEKMGNSTTVIVEIKEKPRSLFCNTRSVIGKLMHIIIYNENKSLQLIFAC
jgi:hypothetical protein